MDLQETVQCVDYIHVAREGDRWRAPANTIIKAGSIEGSEFGSLSDSKLLKKNSAARG
jgi:hypothetical protein